mmetsp:Transcript_13557/g.42600  ORF Transcript_13557/g.42600 Transcript_13557/m.42600 type:complete len:311 (-) Transcript_13557:1792-2724(-)
MPKTTFLWQTNTSTCCATPPQRSRRRSSPNRWWRAWPLRSTISCSCWWIPRSAKPFASRILPSAASIPSSFWATSRRSMPTSAPPTPPAASHRPWARTSDRSARRCCLRLLRWCAASARHPPRPRTRWSACATRPWRRWPRRRSWTTSLATTSPTSTLTRSWARSCATLSKIMYGELSLAPSVGRCSVACFLSVGKQLCLRACVARSSPRGARSAAARAQCCARPLRCPPRSLHPRPSRSPLPSPHRSPLACGGASSGGSPWWTSRRRAWRPCPWLASCCWALPQRARWPCACQRCRHPRRSAMPSARRR